MVVLVELNRKMPQTTATATQLCTGNSLLYSITIEMRRFK